MSGERRDQGEQEVSIRRRKHELFVNEDAAPKPRARPFRDVLRETPAAPPPTWLKAALWAVAIVAALLFAAALYRVVNHHNPPPQRRARSKSKSKAKAPRTSPAAAVEIVAPPILAATAPNPTDQEPRG